MSKSSEILARISTAVGIEQATFLEASTEVRETPLVIDGAPDRFELWAARALNSRSHDRLAKIAEVLKRAKAEDGTP